MAEGSTFLLLGKALQVTRNEEVNDATTGSAENNRGTKLKPAT